MENFEKSQILDQVPILHVRGTNYQVGLATGRTFKDMIEHFYTSDFFNNVVLKNYTTLLGKQTYDDTLRLCETRFPRYVEELRGIAEGSGVPFHKVFMLHIDSLTSAPDDDIKSKKIQADSGCTSILCNNSEIILAQNEDGWPENVNRFYIVVADIVDDDGNKLEKYASLSYSGLLPGYSMGFNNKGVVFTINTLVAKERFAEGSPRWFVTRALLSAANHEEILDIVSDTGVGTADGFSVNICYTNEETPHIVQMYNIEVAPPKIGSDLTVLENKSQVSVKAVSSGQSYVHCNRYLHLQVPEFNELLTSSIRRHEAIGKLPVPSTMKLVRNAMSDHSDNEYPVYRRFQEGGKDGAKTVATGIFDIGQRKWLIYANRPSKSEATAVISMQL